MSTQVKFLVEKELRDSPERSEGEDQFSGERPKEFAGKMTVLVEEKPKNSPSLHSGELPKRVRGKVGKSTDGRRTVVD
jgi:hypothetical protein